MKKAKHPYRFPENAQAKAATANQQIRKILEEAKEVYWAWEELEPDERVIEETWDTINACEGLLRKFPLRKVLVGLVRVKIKCLQRGDYKL